VYYVSYWVPLVLIYEIKLIYEMERCYPMLRIR
jgi:hypothetical protein